MKERENLGKSNQNQIKIYLTWTGLLMEGRSRFDCWSKLLGFDKK